jgi:uncharacterized protein YfaS (alpha-2-macroglobulin family)
LRHEAHDKPLEGGLRMSSRPLLASAAILLAFLVQGCHSPSVPNPPPPRSSSSVSAESKTPGGLRFKLSPANELGPTSAPQANATPLSEAEMQPLFKALPALKSDKDDRKPLALRPASQPPPKLAGSLKQPFPAPAAPERPPVVPEGPLQIVSCSPQGSVEMAPQLQITFNQPMLALSDDNEPGDVPVKLTPQPKGRWRWLGTQTLMFQPEVRFPMATRFELEVPAATASASGAKLKENRHFSFQTPALELKGRSPEGGGQGLQPLLFLEFNQDIQPHQVAPMLKLRGNSEEIPIHQASREQILKDEDIQARVQQAGEKRSLVMALGHKLSPGQAYAVELPVGLPSAEGPLGTEKSQSFSFATYDPLRVEEHEQEIRPDQAFRIPFNNELDQAKLDQKWVRVIPEVPGFKVTRGYQGLSLTGRFKGRTKYQLTLSPTITDRFGQRLGHEERLHLTVGPARPSLKGPDLRMLTLDPDGPQELRFEVTNYDSLRLRAYKVAPSDWDAYVRYLKDPEHLPAPGQPALDRQQATGARPDQPQEVVVDLKPVFPKGLGQAVVMVEPQVKAKESQPRFLGWVQATQLGLDACSDDTQLVAWISHLDSGAAWPGAEVELVGSKARARSRDDGLAVLHPETSGTLLVARQGDDLAILPKNFDDWNSGAWNFRTSSPSTLWHVLDDRRLYRPGESVHIKGWLRRQQRGPDGDLQAARPEEIAYQLFDAEGKKLQKGRVACGGLGGFALELKLPEQISLGSCRLELVGRDGSTFTHDFEVQEFRRPEFEVSAEAEPATSQIGQSARLAAHASYFSGGPLANAKVNWRVHSNPTSFSPPGWEQYNFGSWKPWWGFSGHYGPSGGEPPDNETAREASTDSKGTSRLQVDLLSVDPPQPHSLQAEATVQDVNRQTWTAQTSLLVHPASVYVGLKSEATFVPKGQAMKLSMVVTDLDGKPVAGRPVKLRCYRQQWDDQGKAQEMDLEVRQLTSSLAPQSIELPGHEGGVYVVEARVEDSQNRANAADLSIWVAGQKPRPNHKVAQQELTLIPGQREYQAGDTAEVLVQSPFAPAELLVTTRRDGLARVERLSAPEGSATLKIPLREVDIPGLELQVDALGQEMREDGRTPRPAYASGSLELKLSRAPRALKVAVKPGRSALQPGQSTQVEVQLSDQGGKPVSGLVTLLVVDESVLALTGYDPADPLETFCVGREPGVEDEHSRAFLQLQVQRPERTEAFINQGRNDNTGVIGGAVPAVNYNSAVGSVSGVVLSSPPPPPPSQFKIRSNFTPLAAFEPDVATDAGGRAKITIKLPDNLTRYRLIALAESGVKRFGKGESSLNARKPLQIRPSPPRFANFGDHFQLPVVVQNQTDEAMQVDLMARASNLKLTQPGYRLSLKPQDRVEVRFDCTTQSAGTARLQFGANALAGNDAAEISLPVWTPASSEAFATYGVLDRGTLRQPLRRPAQIFPQFGQLSLTTSSTALAELTDSYLYLRDYPFECSEQLASRVLSTAALRDVLGAFKVPQLDSPEKIKQSLERDAQHLRAMQNEDGGFDFWERDKPSNPYLTVHVAHMLVRLRQKGYPFGQPMWERAAGYLKDIESHLSEPDYSPQTRRSIRAYALYVLELSGQPDLKKARALLEECPLPEQGPEVLAWLLPTLARDKASADAVITYLDNHSNQTAATAQFSFNYNDKGYLVLYSDSRDEALILESLIRVRPRHPLIPKLVRGLLDHRRQGRWENTQENCWVLLAMDAYFQHFEKTVPNFAVRLWLGNRFGGQQIFKGRERDEKQIEVPMAELPDQADLILSKQGPGRLYYRLGMTYCSGELKSQPLDNGFAVQRQYQAVADNRDVSRDSEGVWHIKAGALVRVNLTMQTPSQRYQVALVDPLPAGLEAIHPELLGAESAPPANHLDGWWSNYWFDHQNLRDERIETFASQLGAGVYHYSYLARATTPGQFVVPPSKAEEMYHPETFGRTASEKVIIQ